MRGIKHGLVSIEQRLRCRIARVYARDFSINRNKRPAALFLSKTKFPNKKNRLIFIEEFVDKNQVFQKFLRFSYLHENFLRREYIT